MRCVQLERRDSGPGPSPTRGTETDGRDWSIVFFLFLLFFFSFLPLIDADYGTMAWRVPGFFVPGFTVACAGQWRALSPCNGFDRVLFFVFFHLPVRSPLDLSTPPRPQLSLIEF